MDLSKMVRPQLAQVVNMFVALVEVMLALAGRAEVLLHDSRW